MKKHDLEKLEKKVLSKKWGSKKPVDEFEVYREDEKMDKLGWQEPKRVKRSKKRISGMFWTFLLSVFSAIFLYYYYFIAPPIFDPSDVKVYITGPEKVSSGDLVSYKVSYRNNSKVVLRDVSLSFEWPAGSLFEGEEYSEPVKIERRVGVLMPSQEKSVILEGRIYGQKDSQKSVKSVLTYRPEELQKKFSSYKDMSVSIEAVPIFLNVTLSDQVVSGKEVEFKIEYINESDAVFSNMEIRAEYPSGFEFISSDPNPVSSNNVWQLGTVQGEEEGSIIVRGVFSGAEGEQKIISVDIGQRGLNSEEFTSVANSLAETKIASSALLVFQTVNGAREASASLGDTLNYKISYKNTTNTQISNVVVLAQIDDKVIDLSTLDIPWGSFDGRTNSIIWNQSGVPGLAVLDPGEEGYVSFSVKLKKSLIPTSVNDKNFTIKSTAQIASGSTPTDLKGVPVENQDVLEVKVNTVLGFNVSAYYKDGPIQNTGPIPPRVGQETTYAISWQIANTTNDAKDVVVEASIPPNIKWTGVVDPKDANITFDQERGVVRWEPGVVFAGSGYTIPSQRVDFQLSFLPALVHVGKVFDLTSDATLTATDVFTGNEIKRELKGIDSGLNGKVKAGEARVVR